MQPLQGQAQVERFAHCSLCHPPVSGSPCNISGRARVRASSASLAYHAIARTHGADVLPAAFPNTHAAHDGMGKAAVVIARIAEMGGPLWRVVINAETQVFVGVVGIDDLPGFIFHSGSQMRFNSRNACINSGPNILGNSSPRDWPSPCSPDSRLVTEH